MFDIERFVEDCKEATATDPTIAMSQKLSRGHSVTLLRLSQRWGSRPKAR